MLGLPYDFYHRQHQCRCCQLPACSLLTLLGTNVGDRFIFDVHAASWCRTITSARWDTIANIDYCNSISMHGVPMSRSARIQPPKSCYSYNSQCEQTPVSFCGCCTSYLSLQYKLPFLHVKLDKPRQPQWISVQIFTSFFRDVIVLLIWELLCSDCVK